jgi:hypothetical protein
MVACHLNLQFQIFAVLKGTKVLVLAHFIDVPLWVFLIYVLPFVDAKTIFIR